MAVTSSGLKAITAFTVLPWLTVACCASAIPVKLYGPYVVAEHVYLNGTGPLRFLIDTGAQSSMVSPIVAKRLALRATYAVIRVTVAGDQKVPAHVVEELSLGSAEARNVELMEAPFEAASQAAGRLDGILGMNFLGQFAWMVDRENKTLQFDLDGALASHLKGERVAVRPLDGRLGLSVRAGGKDMSFVLDSGASHLIFFGEGTRKGRARSLLLDSNDGYREVLTRRIPRLEVGKIVLEGKLAALLPAEGRQEGGLMPMSLFDPIYVNAKGGFVVFPR